MSYSSKQNPNLKSHPKTTHIRKPIKHPISHHFHDDLPLLHFNPFSEQLTPWNGSSKLQASINLLTKENTSKFITKHQSIDHQPTVQNIVVADTIDYCTLAFRSSYEKPSSRANSYTCPRLKVVNQSINGQKEQNNEAKRYLFNKKQMNTNKNVKKIANLTIEWDQQIVYNPEKKHFQQQSMKRKILRQFSHTRNQNRNQISKKDHQKSPQKLLKFQFRNNKIHGKQVSVFEFKKKQLSLQINRTNSKKDKSMYETPHLEALIQNNQNNMVSEIKVNTLDFKPQSSGASLEIDGSEGKPVYRTDKWNFRTSLKARLPLAQGKKGAEKQLRNKEKQRLNKEEKAKKEKQALNRITLEFNQNIKEQKFAPLQVLSRTSPCFFRKQPA